MVMGGDEHLLLVDSDGRLAEKASPWDERRRSTAATAMNDDDVLDTIVSVVSLKVGEYFASLGGGLLDLVGSGDERSESGTKKIKNPYLTSQRFVQSMDYSCLGRDNPQLHPSQEASASRNKGYLLTYVILKIQLVLGTIG